MFCLGLSALRKVKMAATPRPMCFKTLFSCFIKGPFLRWFLVSDFDIYSEIMHTYPAPPHTADSSLSLWPSRVHHCLCSQQERDT